MKIEGVIWIRDVVDKLAFKHQVETDEASRRLVTYQSSASWKKENERAKMYIWLWDEPMRDGTCPCSSSTRRRKKL